MMIPIRVTPNDMFFLPKASFHVDSADGDDHNNQHDVTIARLVNSKDARLPVQLQRAMAAEAEAAREARAKVMMVMVLEVMMMVLMLFLVMMMRA